MTAHEQRVLAARMDSLPLAVAFVEAFCAQHGVARGDLLRLTLIVEELFTNIVKHGHGGDSDAPVRLTLQAATAHLALGFEDSAPPFDPRQHLDRAAPDLDAELGQRQVGGLGIPLVAELAHRIDYAYVDGLNRLQLWVLRES